jgi:ankyrin repeat protein
VVKEYLEWACHAGLDLPVIRGLAEKCGKAGIDSAAQYGAAWGGHTDVLDLLASEFGARIGVDCLNGAARWGHDAMIDHLVEEHGVDPNVADAVGWTALHCAAYSGRFRTVKHLVEKHNVDIHKRARWGGTALDLAETYGRTECAAYLRALQSTRPPPS